MATIGLFPEIIGFTLFGLAILHAVKCKSNNVVQRILLIILLFLYGLALESAGVASGNYHYAKETIMFFDEIPLSVTLAWSGIIYSAMVIGEKLKLPRWFYILFTTCYALSLDWGMDPIAVDIGLWTWTYGGSYFTVPAFNFIGWFFIPIAFILPYGFRLNLKEKQFKLLTISEVDQRKTILRKIYTLFVVIPIAIGVLTLVGMFTRIPFIYNLPSFVIFPWMALTIVFTTGILIWKRKNLHREKWTDIIPPLIILYIASSYFILSLFIMRFDLSILSLYTMIPIIIAFLFTVKKKRA